jgi:hypothetical protein
MPDTTTLNGHLPFAQGYASHSMPIGQALWSGLAQSVFSAPARSSASIPSQCISAPRRHAKNALHYVVFKVMLRSSVNAQYPCGHEALLTQHK